MRNFMQYLNLLTRLKKEKRFDEAWRVANEGLIDLSDQKDDLWYIMYYHMADILVKEKKWEQALLSMSYVIYFHHGLGGITHEKLVKRILKILGVESSFNDYIQFSLITEPLKLPDKVKKLLEIKKI